jgi:hypothetical protein
MPAEIMGLYSKSVKFVSTRVVPWWDVQGATVFPDKRGMTATEAAKAAGVDFQITKQPLVVMMPDGSQQTVPDKAALVREATGEEAAAVLGIVEAEYPLLQNVELARALDPISAKWPVETVGALRRGENVFFVLNAGERTGPGGELHTNYWLTNEWRDGSGALEFMFSPVCQVCINTYRLAMDRASFRVAIPHGPQFHADADVYLGLFSQLAGVEERAYAAFDHLALIPMPAPLAKEKLELIFPVADVPQVIQQLEAMRAQGVDTEAMAERERQARERYELTIGRQQGRRALCLERFDLVNQQRPAIQGTAWALYQAVSEVLDHTVSRGGKQRGESILFGDRGRTMERAFALLAKA